MKAEIRVMLKAGLSEEKAEICAQTHTEGSRDGVYSIDKTVFLDSLNTVKVVNSGELS